MTLLLIITVALCMLWVIALYPTYRFVKDVKVFEELEVNLNRENFPEVTVIVTACNEEHTIERPLRSILVQDYPALKVVAVNDRSADQTGDILDNLKKEFSHLEVIHISQLPDGWLGKVNALNQGIQSAGGEYCIFTDADVFFQQGLIKKSVSYCMGKNLGHFTLLPDPVASSFLLKVVYQTFGFVFITVTRAYNVGKKGKSEYVGCGAFNMVRKDIFDRTEGFKWLKMEVADDVGVGLLMKKNGAVTDFATTFKSIQLDWYPSLKAMFKGLEKNFFGVSTGFSFLKFSMIVPAMIFAAFAPFVAFLLSVSTPYVFIAGVAAISSHIAAVLMGYRRFGFPVLPGLCLPVGLLILCAMLIRSGVMCLFHRGIYWRGTFYPVRQLRQGRRVQL